MSLVLSQSEVTTDSESSLVDIIEARNVRAFKKKSACPFRNKIWRSFIAFVF
jgi:hypothetical protein